MSSKLHLTLGILMAGFAIEGAIEGYTLLSRTYDLPYSAVIFILGPFVTLTGLLCLWVGRLEWSEVVARRFRHAHRTFWLSLLALLMASAPVIWLAYDSTTPVPSWAEWVFGAAVLCSLLLTYATYVLIGFELTGLAGRSMLVIAFAWATAVAFWIAHALSERLSAIVALVQARAVEISPINSSIADFEAYLVVTYMLLLIAYLDAYHRLLMGSEKHLRPELRKGSLRTDQQ